MLPPVDASSRNPHRENSGFPVLQGSRCILSSIEVFSWVCSSERPDKRKTDILGEYSQPSNRIFRVDSGAHLILPVTAPSGFTLGNLQSCTTPARGLLCFGSQDFFFLGRELRKNNESRLEILLCAKWQTSRVSSEQHTGESLSPNGSSAISVSSKLRKSR